MAFWPATARAATDEPTYALSWSRSEGFARRGVQGRRRRRERRHRAADQERRCRPKPRLLVGADQRCVDDRTVGHLARRSRVDGAPAGDPRDHGDRVLGGGRFARGPFAGRDPSRRSGRFVPLGSGQGWRRLPHVLAYLPASLYPQRISSVVVDSRAIYFTASATDHTEYSVWYTPRAGGMAVRASTALIDDCLAVTQDHVFWADRIPAFRTFATLIKVMDRP